MFGNTEHLNICNIIHIMEIKQLLIDKGFKETIKQVRKQEQKQWALILILFVVLFIGWHCIEAKRYEKEMKKNDVTVNYTK